MTAEPEGDDPPFSARDTGRSRKGELTLFFGAAGVLAFAAALVLKPEPDPTLVVVAVRGCSSPCRENLALSLSFVLETQGFQVSERTGEDVLEMHGLSQLARNQYARHRLLLDVGRFETESDTTYVEVRGEVRSGEEAPVERSIIVALEAARTERVDTEPLRDEDAVRIEAGLLAIDALTPDLVSALLSSRAVQRYLDGEPRDTMTAFRRHTDLKQAAEDDGQRVMNIRSFDVACDEIHQEYAAPGDEVLGVECLTPSCEEEHLVGFSPRVVVQQNARFAVFPLRAEHDVRTAPVPQRLFVRGNGDGAAEVERARARHIYGYASVHGDDIAFISASDSAFTLYSHAGDARTLLAQAERPGVLSNPKLGEAWVLFERRPFPGADPVLLAARRDGTDANEQPPDAVEVTPFGVQGDWIRLAGPASDRSEFVAVWVAGIRHETLAATGAQGDGEQIDEAAAIDDLDDDVDAESLARVAAGLPAKDHIALIRLGDEGPQLVNRFGGRGFALSYAQATPSGALVMIRAGLGGCELIRLAPQDWATLQLEAHSEDWVRMESCPTFPVVSERAVYGTERVSGAGDPFEGDMEIVRYDMWTGARSQLTFNGIDEQYVRVQQQDSATRVGFERVPAPRFARFRPTGVCVFDESP